MFRIEPNRDPAWRDVAEGIRMQLRFGPTEARNAGRRHVRDVMKADPDADGEFAFVVGVLLWGVVAWEGVGAPLPDGAEGAAAAEVAELNAENLSALLRQRPDIYDDLDRSYVDEVVEAMSEKNASRPSPNGTSAEAQPTAPAATGPAARNASTKSSAPAATPETASGV